MSVLGDRHQKQSRAEVFQDEQAASREDTTTTPILKQSPAWETGMFPAGDDE